MLIREAGSIPAGLALVQTEGRSLLVKTRNRFVVTLSSRVCFSGVVLANTWLERLHRPWPEQARPCWSVRTGEVVRLPEMPVIRFKVYHRM